MHHFAVRYQFCIILIFTGSVVTFDTFKSNINTEEDLGVKNETGKPVVGIFDLVRNVDPAEYPQVEPYSKLQLELEQKAENIGLYRNSYAVDEILLNELLADPEIQTIIAKCKQFHETPRCRNEIYHRNDGTCNNLKYPKCGSTNTFQDRFLPAAYTGIRKFRRSANGEELPEPRGISLKMKNFDVFEKKVSALFTFFGQAIAHDMTSVPSQSHDGIAITCCPYQPGNQLNSPLCENVYIKKDDPFYGEFNFTCIPFPRKAPFPKCDFGKRDAQNKVTSYLDLSLIYGSDDDLKTRNLRTNDSSGRLTTQESLFGKLLRKNENKNLQFCLINDTENCFKSGDGRVNQHTILTCLHTAFDRYHNIIADILAVVNPHWNGDTIYQEARKLSVAVEQHLVYSEYLPLLVGHENMVKYNLMTHTRSQYDQNVCGNTLLEFSTAAYRLHSMIPENISKYHPETTMDSSFSFYQEVHLGKCDSYIAGSSELESMKNDIFVIDDVTNNLYKPREAFYGIDLASINIQRGRDNGLPVYIDVLEKCSDGQIKIQSFSDLIIVMPKKNIAWLKSIYSFVEDIDLWVGLLAETLLEGAVTGPTTACLISTQFHTAKFGDTFFYTHSNGRYPFSEEQLKFIKGYSLARWICETTNYPVVRRYAFELPNIHNPLVSCESFPPIDLRAWKTNNCD